jgi:hypothetical protein
MTPQFRRDLPPSATRRSASAPYWIAMLDPRPIQYITWAEWRTVFILGMWGAAVVLRWFERRRV